MVVVFGRGGAAVAVLADLNAVGGCAIAAGRTVREMARAESQAGRRVIAEVIVQSPVEF